MECVWTTRRGKMAAGRPGELDEGERFLTGCETFHFFLPERIMSLRKTLFCHCSSFDIVVCRALGHGRAKLGHAQSFLARFQQFLICSLDPIVLPQLPVSRLSWSGDCHGPALGPIHG